MMICIMLLVVVFIAGFINTSFYIPPNKLLSYLQSFLPYKSYSNISTRASPPPQPKKKRSSHELEKAFATMDKNGDGFITRQELKESLKSIGLYSNDGEVASMIDKLDRNGDGLIDIDEFYDMWEGDGKVKEEEEEGELREAFDVFDGDRDGLISVEELDWVLSSLGLKKGMRIEDCKEMISMVDIDGDGMVNFDEFKQMMRGGGSLISVS